MNSGPQVVEKPAEAKKEQEDNNLDRTESEEREEIGEGQGSKCTETASHTAHLLLSVIPGLVHYCTIMIAHEMCSNLASCSDCLPCGASSPAFPALLGELMWFYFADCKFVALGCGWLGAEKYSLIGLFLSS
ncbi:hypothetical protein POTOM_045988 [Populus tomentosa]|uniref:Uncharacterized protein n=1 Tax=Populus tomentosa TaxID=118781 RepID=A0A8X7YF16_POPTO|nr:hypothetical protein POTOM_045988 [Populus tomentosa]